MVKKLYEGFTPLLVLVLVTAIGIVAYITKPWEKLQTLFPTIDRNTSTLAVNSEPVTLTFNSMNDPSTGIVRSIRSTWPPTSSDFVTIGTASDGNVILTFLDAGSYFVQRGFVSFDTTSIPSNATIVSATIDLWVSTVNFNNDNNTSIEIVSANQGPTLTIEDYDNIGSVSFAGAPLASLVKNDAGRPPSNNLPLNSSGLAAINKGGTTRIGLRTGLDLRGIAPTGINQMQTALDNNEIKGIRLIVTYELPNNLPVAVAGTSLAANGRLQLDGSLSTDLDGTIASYSWQIEGETTPRTGQTVSIADLKRGNYNVTLTVTDDKGAVNSDTMLFGITVFTGNPPGGSSR